MTIELHTPQGVVEVDPATITDTELASLGLTRAWANEQAYQEQLAQDANDALHVIKDKLENWDTLPPPERAEATKSLLTCVLNLYRGQY